MKRVDPITRVRKTIEKFELLSGGERVLVAFSGGPDSVFLLEALLKLKEDLDLALALAHFHHGLRGEEADRDLEFSQKKAREFGIPFFFRKKDLKKKLEKGGDGIETVARFFRLEFLLEALEEWGGDIIATGHTLTDSIETSFFNLLRGTGLAGLSGIPPKRGIWIRPLIEVTREEVRAYLDERGLESRLDRTNLEPQTPRNYLRLKVFPLLEERFKGFEKRWARSLELLRDSRFIVEMKIREVLEELKKRSPEGSILLDRDAFLNLPLPIQRYLIHSIKGLNFKETEEVLSLVKNMGKRKLPDGSWCVASYSDLLISKYLPKLEGVYEIKLGENLIEELNMVVELKEGKTPQRGDYTASIPKRSVFLPLKIRKREEGDRALKGGILKKVKEIFQEKRVPLWRRDLYPVFEDRKGIVWIPGLTGPREESRRGPYYIISIRRLKDERFWVYDT